jgi:hypothetical protein
MSSTIEAIQTQTLYGGKSLKQMQSSSAKTSEPNSSEAKQVNEKIKGRLQQLTDLCEEEQQAIEKFIINFERNCRDLYNYFWLHKKTDELSGPYSLDRNAFKLPYALCAITFSLKKIYFAPLC